MKKTLGLDLGTNSIGWALVQSDIEVREGNILGAGSRIIPMGQDVLGKFDAGVGISRTADRTRYRGMRRLYQRDNLRRDRLHRVLNLIGYLPEHYVAQIDFDKHLGQFKKEVKLNYRPTSEGHQFIFMDAFHAMVQDFKERGRVDAIPFDWTIYYLRAKALRAKLSKEELAWIILNFNQKRGYYQLRGEDVEEDNSKEFVQLKVRELVDSGEEVKGNKLYDVYFENDWKYDRQITKTEDWVDRTKEFIVSKKVLASGETKYTYKAVDSEKDWPAIKAKTEQDIDRSGKTVGQYIYDALVEDSTTKIRGKLVKTIERKYYKAELKKILDSQAQYHPALTDADVYRAAVEHLYPKNEAHRNNIKGKDLGYLLMEDIIFYQRPLKSKKSTIGTCQFEKRSFQHEDKKGNKVVVQEPIKAIPKSHPLYQEFRLWQFVRNLRIIDKEQEVISKKKGGGDVTAEFFKTEHDIVDLYEYLNGRKEVEQKNVIDYLVKKGLVSKEDKKAEKYSWNYVSDKKYPCNETRNDIVKRLSRVEGVKVDKFLTGEVEVALWHIIYSVKDKNEFEKAMRTFAKKNGLDVDSFVEAFKKMPPYKNDYGTLSYKAINKLLQLMRMGKYWSKDGIDAKTMTRINKIMDGEYDENIRKRVRDKAMHLSSIGQFKGLPLWLSSYIVYDRHSEVGDIAEWKTPGDIETFLNKFKQHSLRNPIVEQVVLETLRVVKDIWLLYGKGQQGYFDNINLELGRELKNSADKRERISKRNQENENTNVRVRELLVELMNDRDVAGDVRPHSPSHQEILKIYEEGVYDNPNVNYSIVSEDEVDKIRKKKSPSKNDITRYKLWLEQGYISPYTGALIPLSKLFTTDYEIEHIIPQSRYFDNSLSNKVICEADVNQDKGSMTAYEYILRKGGDMVDGHQLLTVDTYEVHCQKYFKKNRTKLANLMSEEIPEGFINRQMNDSRYIAKYVKGLLSNIVREEGEQEPTSKNLLPVSGAITSKLRQDWGLNDKWNALVAPRFKRLNELTDSQDFGYFDKSINAFRCTVPDDLKRGFSKKRIDHRHHALDAIVLACTTREHVNYLNSLNSQRQNHSLRSKLLKTNKNGDITKHFKSPWSSFAVGVLNTLSTIVVSFKKDTRVINKTNNKTWQWVEDNGTWKKKLVRQTKGDSWAIRRNMHDPMPYGKLVLPYSILKLKDSLGKADKIIDRDLRQQVISYLTENGSIGKAQKALKNNPITYKGKKVEQTAFDEESEKYFKRKDLGYLYDTKRSAIVNRIYKVVGLDNQLALLDHLGKFESPEEAFSVSGIVEFRANEVRKGRTPMKKIKIAESGSKRFRLGEAPGASHKYVEATDGTNLYFAIYFNSKTNKRVYQTVPFREVIEHQKQVSHLPKKDRLPIQPDPTKGDFLFTLSPNDLVYVPTDEEMEHPNTVDFEDLSKEQYSRLFNVNDFSNTCYFTPNFHAKAIRGKEVDLVYDSKKKKLTGSFDNKTASFEGNQIKERCWKLGMDRLGNISMVNNIKASKGYLTSENAFTINDPTTKYRKITISNSFEEAEERNIAELRKFVAETTGKQRMVKTMELIRRSFAMIKNQDREGSKKLIIIKSSL